MFEMSFYFNFLILEFLLQLVKDDDLISWIEMTKSEILIKGNDETIKF